MDRIATGMPTHCNYCFCTISMSSLNKQHVCFFVLLNYTPHSLFSGKDKHFCKWMFSLYSDANYQESDIPCTEVRSIINLEIFHCALWITFLSRFSNILWLVWWAKMSACIMYTKRPWTMLAVYPSFLWVGRWSSNYGIELVCQTHR